MLSNSYASHCYSVNSKISILLTSHMAQTQFIRPLRDEVQPVVSHHDGRWIKSVVSKLWSTVLKVCQDLADLENFSCFDSAIKSCSKKFTSQKHILSWWYDWQNLTGANAGMQPQSAWRTVPFLRLCSKSLSVKASVIATATWWGYQWERKSLRDLLYLRDVYGIKSCGHFWLFLPRSWRESELLLPQRNRRSIILGCLYFRGDPCTVPGGSCDEMSHQIRNPILKFSCHKKILLWLYSSTLTPLQKNKDSVSEWFLFCFEHCSHTLNEKELSCSG